MSNHTPTNDYIRYERSGNQLKRVKVTRSMMNNRLTVTHVKEMEWDKYEPEFSGISYEELNSYGACKVTSDEALTPNELKQYLRETGHLREAGAGQPYLALNEAGWKAHYEESHDVTMGLEPLPLDNARFMPADPAIELPLDNAA